MSTLKKIVSLSLLLFLTQLGLVANSQEQSMRLGTPISQDQLRDFDLIAPPDGSGFPAGSGTARQGRSVFNTKCAACHAENGEGTSAATRLVGGDMHSAGTPLRTVGSYWPYASTIFDYVRRAMPANAPKSLSNEEVYQVTAFLLFLNEIIPENMVLDSESLLQVEMPNADGFIDRSQVQ
jgi:S-disulfanyl-L-cysteine oxidoreductase SoxD